MVNEKYCLFKIYFWFKYVTNTVFIFLSLYDVDFLWLWWWKKIHLLGLEVKEIIICLALIGWIIKSVHRIIPNGIKVWSLSWMTLIMRYWIVWSLYFNLTIQIKHTLILQNQLILGNHSSLYTLENIRALETLSNRSWTN